MERHHLVIVEAQPGRALAWRDACTAGEGLTAYQFGGTATGATAINFRPLK